MTFKKDFNYSQFGNQYSSFVSQEIDSRTIFQTSRRVGRLYVPGCNIRVAQMKKKFLWFAGTSIKKTFIWCKNNCGLKFFCIMASTYPWRWNHPQTKRSYFLTWCINFSVTYNHLYVLPTNLRKIHNFVFIWATLLHWIKLHDFRSWKLKIKWKRFSNLPWNLLLLSAWNHVPFPSWRYKLRPIIAVAWLCAVDSEKVNWLA